MSGTVSRVRTILGGLRRRTAPILKSPAVLSFGARAVFVDAPRLRGARRSGGTSGRAILIAPPGAGNIGDAALVGAFLENVGGPITVITRYPGDIRIPAEQADRVEIVSLGTLLYGGLPSFVRDLRRFRAMLPGAASVSIVGADIMDGAYNFRASTSRAVVARSAAAAGVDTRVLGFSWNGKAHPAALAQLREADRAGTTLYLRDPLSVERARRDGLDAKASADIVFSARSVDPERASTELATVDTDGGVAIVNVSGLIDTDQTGAYVEIIGGLRARGFAVVLLPHVIKHGPDDLAACRKVFAALPDTSGVVFIEDVLTPAQVRGFTERATVTVTGRMHLAIMSLMKGVPAITLATQGKVEGLMAMFELPYLCVEPGAGLAGRVGEALERVLSDRDAVSAAILAKLPAVQELSAANFEGLPRA
ncbi:Polysaccharide pyruvyl transferase family protein WcaK [Rathayibacter oskolensis]|uniref:Polysaccharide pyruvyl transferase family protein WcaK n=1 Tax=Rathayibacter oskolensis TaxID=1891671 RepID=A0A1X7MS38_9MICO|nr:polysaccharide pyruvyl transferase family protein [Rathayibacter oskolensis]SMH27659.1 Polysaccharide pyruvyl transferase family protein WcaK [Rathayibacter oskolensis]